MDLFVTSDDRTGAFETAAALADAGAGSVDVLRWSGIPPEPSRVVVIDLGTRHLSATGARERMMSVQSSARRGHKIDSTLRGNWPDELAVMAAARPVLLIPALPELGRVCVDGIVLEHGRPVHESGAGSDVRRRVTTARPAELLHDAGCSDVTSLRDVAATGEWLTRPHGIAVADAGDMATIERLVAVWAEGRSDVALAGTAAVVGAAGRSTRGAVSPVSFPPIEPPVLIACGSVHPAARAQLDHAEHRGIPVTTLADDLTARRLADSEALVLATEIPVGDVDAPLAVAAASGLARGVEWLRRSVHVGALVLIGGDTTAAVLGDAAVTVHGSIAAGTAWADVAGFEMPVITRAGGFGGEGALVDLIRATLQA